MTTRTRRHREENPLEDTDGLLSLPYKRPKLAATTAKAFLKNLSPADCADQSQSAFLKILPPALKNVIFELVMVPEMHEPSEDVLVAALEKERTYLEGCEGVSCTVDTALLRVCRAVYLEARWIPVRSAVHDFYGYRWNRFGGVPDTDIPHYGRGKRLITNGPGIHASSTIYHRSMSTPTLSQVQEVSLYEIALQTYALGHSFWGMKALRPRRVFIACVLDGHWKVDKKQVAWHDELEEVKLRIDVHPRDEKKLGKVGQKLEKRIKTSGGVVLERVDEESNVRGTWRGLDRKGEMVEWLSVTNVWRVR